MNFPNDPDLRRVHKYLTDLKSFKCYVDKLEDHFQDIHDVKSKVLSNNSVFWTAQLGRNKWEVRPKVNVRLCVEYFCHSCEGECGQLHLCRQFLISPSSCSNPCKHRLSHNIGDKHNKNIVKNVFPKYASHWIKIKLLRSTFPRLCKAFTDQGSCKKIFCGYFHICADYVRGNCPIGSCNQASLSGISKGVVHDFRREHNTKVRNLFSFGTEFNKDEILGSILMPFGESQVSVPDDIYSACSDISDLRSDVGDMESDVSDFEYSDVSDLESINRLPSVTTVSHLQRIEVKLCYFYLMERCRNEKCSSLHLCKEFLINGNKCSKVCKYGYSHDPYDEHNKPIVESGSSEIPKPKMLEILRRSFPRVCKDYEEMTCFSGDKCDRLHICSKTLSNAVCMKGGCVNSHNLKDDHNSRVFKLYSIAMTGSKKTNMLVNVMVSNRVLRIDRSVNNTKSSEHDLTRSIQNISTSLSPNANSAIYQNNLAASSSKIDVFPERLKLKICFHYINGNCTNTKCPRLHMCKEFLISEKKCKEAYCPYGLSHEPFDEHNKLIIEKKNIITPTKIKVLHVLRNSFPRVCRDYPSGKCRSLVCEKIHACSNTLLNRTCVRMDCCLSHNIHDVHNSYVLKIYSLNVNAIQRLNVSYVLASVLYSSIQSDVNNMSGGIESNCTSTRSVSFTNLASKSSTSNLAYLESPATLATEYKSFLSKHDTGEVVISRDFPLCSNFSSDRFITLHLKCGSQVVSVCPRDFKPCFYYWQKKTGCTSRNCDMIHICRSFLHNKKHKNEISCGQNHTFQSQHNQTVLRDSNLHTLSTEQILLILRLRYPQVCKEYMEGHCWYGEDHCRNLHVCPEFLKGACGDACGLNHEEGLKNQRAKELMKSFHISEKDFRNCVILPQQTSTQIKPKISRRRKSTVSSNVIILDKVDALPVTHACAAMEEKESSPGHIIRAEKILKSALKTTPATNLYHASTLPMKQPMPNFNQQPPLAPNFTKVNQVKKTETINSDPIYGKKEQAISKPCASFPATPSSQTQSNIMERMETFQGKMDVNVKAPEMYVSTNCSNSFYAPTAARPNLDLSSLKKSATPFVEPSEIDVFAYILDYGSRCTYDLTDARLFGDLDFFQDRMGVNEIVSRWFEEHLSTFRIVREEGTVTYGDSYYLCVDTIAPCYEYWTNNCRNKNCDKFHLCKKFLHSIQHSGISCPYNHSFKDQHEQQLIFKYKLQPLSEKQLTLLLKMRYPSVCEVYLSSGCADKRKICQYVHICGDFLEGKCAKPKGLCNYNHELGLTGTQATRLMKEFHIDSPEDFKKCIIHWKSDPKHSWKYQSHHKALKANFNWLRKEAICYKHINGECDSCNVFHLDTGLPYSWQYYQNDSWSMFDAHLNVEIEKSFCDPNSELFDSYAVNKSQPKRLVIPKDSNWKSAIFGRAPVHIRRLSTKSSVLVEDKEAAGLTKWKWYWKNGNTWDEYTKWTTSSSIETVFLKTPKGTFSFSTDEFTYSLSFVSMKQQNMDERYFTKREVRRRPVYKTKQDMRCVTQVITIKNYLPWNWPIKDPNLSLKGGRIDVNLSTRQKIENTFKASMNHGVHVLDLEEVCNAEFYESYQSKKRSVKARNGSSGVSELTLYHGTDHTVVEGICAQNFDWRLCGKNATAYGQGSYFAKNASYSHNYTTPDSKNLRYMFVAQVLVGRYAKGNSTMKRPPAVNPSVDAHTLYDSCVDDQNNPSIYVIFERDQCYPQYLITYTDTVTGNYYNIDIGILNPVTSYVPKQRPQPLKAPPKTLAKPSLSKVSANYSASSLNTISSNSNSASNSNIYNNNSSNNNNNNNSNNNNSGYNRRYSSGSNNDSKKCVIS